MNNKYVFAVVGLVVGLAAGYFMFSSSSPVLGAPTANQALDQQRLLTELTAMYTDATAIRAPLSGLIQASAAMGAQALGPVGSTTSTTSTAITAAVAAVGDSCLVGTSTSTANTTLDCQVTAASTTVVTARNDSGTAQSLTATTFYVTVLPYSTFKAAAALTQ